MTERKMIAAQISSEMDQQIEKLRGEFGQTRSAFLRRAIVLGVNQLLEEEGEKERFKDEEMREYLDHQTLVELLSRFFRLGPNAIYSSPAWKLLKKELSERRNWRNAPRGTPTVANLIPGGKKKK